MITVFHQQIVTLALVFFWIWPRIFSTPPWQREHPHIHRVSERSLCVLKVRTCLGFVSTSPWTKCIFITLPTGLYEPSFCCLHSTISTLCATHACRHFPKRPPRLFWSIKLYTFRQHLNCLDLDDEAPAPITKFYSARWSRSRMYAGTR